MLVEVRVFSGLEKYLVGKRFGEPLPVELGAGETLKGLLKQLGIPEKDVFNILVDGKHQSLDYAVKGGERISFFPPVGGG